MILERKVRIAIWLGILIALLLCIELPIILYRGTLTTNESPENVRLFSEDGSILVQWDEIKAFNLKAIQVVVTDDDQTIVTEALCDPHAKQFCFAEGEHGKGYTFAVSMVLTDGQRSNETIHHGIFLEYEKLPALPFLNICTENAQMPTYEVAYPPEGCGGLGIQNNEYIPSEMIMTHNGRVVHDNPCMIRVRGNTSAGATRKPYKLLMEASVDLLSDGKYAHTEWLLLPFDNLNFVVGTELALICGMEWQPRFCLVNLMIGGDYLGTYFLTESVCRDEIRCNLEESGYLIELDTYWWNNKDQFFKIEGQFKPTGYTFKYPDDAAISTQRVKWIREYMNKCMHSIFTGDPTYLDYIDIDSWAGWLMTHDLRGTHDFAGSNLYYNKADFDPENPTSTKLKMGPVWDVHSMYVSKNEWATVRGFHDAGFVYLLEQPAFQEAYLRLWQRISPTLCQSVLESTSAWIEEYGSALEDSLYLDSIRWNVPCKNLKEEILLVEEWFSSRVEWMNEQLYP